MQTGPILTAPAPKGRYPPVPHDNGESFAPLPLGDDKPLYRRHFQALVAVSALLLIGVGSFFIATLYLDPAPTNPSTVTSDIKPPVDSPNITLSPTSEPTATPSTLISTPTPTSTPSATPTCQLTADPFDVLFILDESRSVGRTNYSIMLDSVVRFVARQPIGIDGVRIGLIEFSGRREKVLIENALPYPSTNLKEVAIQDTVNMDDFDESSKSLLLQRIGSLNYSAPDCPFGESCEETIEEAEFRGEENHRAFTCISCAFQYALDEYFPTPGNTIFGRDRLVIFIGDGNPTRGDPLEPAEPLSNLRDAFPFKLVFLPIINGQAGSFNVDAFGTSFNETIDYRKEVSSLEELDQSLSSFDLKCL